MRQYIIVKNCKINATTLKRVDLEMVVFHFIHLLTLLLPLLNVFTTYFSHVCSWLPKQNLGFCQSNKIDIANSFKRKSISW